MKKIYMWSIIILSSYTLHASNFKKVVTNGLLYTGGMATMCTLFDQIVAPGSVLALSKVTNNKESHEKIAQIVRQKSLLRFLKNQ